MSSRYRYIAYALILLVAGLVLLWQVRNSTVRVTKTQLFFKAAHAKVVDVSVRELKQIGDGEYAEIETAFLPAISYVYEIGGREYSSDRYWVTDMGGERAWAESVTASYAKGSDIQIFYDPDSPEYSVVTKSVPNLTSQRISIGIVGGIVCLFSAGIYVRNFRNPDFEVDET